MELIECGFYAVSGVAVLLTVMLVWEKREHNRIIREYRADYDELMMKSERERARLYELSRVQTADEILRIDAAHRIEPLPPRYSAEEIAEMEQTQYDWDTVGAVETGDLVGETYRR